MNLQYVRVEMVKEKEIGYPGTVFNGADCYKVLKEFFAKADREILIVVCLNGKLNVAAINQVSIGDLEHAPVHPREVFKPAILANAARVILAHNHPSGDSFPSKEDVEVAKQMISAGRLMKIPMEDFIIVGDDDYYSLREHQPSLF